MSTTRRPGRPTTSCAAPGSITAFIAVSAMQSAPATLVQLGQRAIGARSPVAKELPLVADLADQIHVEVVHQKLVPIAAGDLLDQIGRASCRERVCPYV